MVERTENLEELERLLGEYCKKEYPHLKKVDGKNLSLSSIDGGGYCADGMVTFNIEDGEFTLDVVTEKDPKTLKTLETKTFRFKLA
tara:strand:+ start:1329 stop:1586 length:258 start_codon:yes stop_codon:yes gene_type:complete